ncbi:N,N-dimethylformamidase beta subunit family domain-containing protein [Tautonia sociabilis]|uniref:Carboxypeptidase regulatory-like domain-containing protein n=1 Tax=Tautonia sociabilis TaxID=2080755 RepID=A0A432MLK1_9BACT|nr:N,N-dimethylformamidase beta subunit family domain-containing protein [Tautonia sociabilis]RUL88282.1 carboxypeptidase regulatory-like domain-containing protein [Tautonia sociabilis]
MLIGFVSDERYVALPGVSLEFLGPSGSVSSRSRADGSVHAALVPGPYVVTLAASGFGAKRVLLDVPPGRPHHFRLLSDRLLGYAWPKWVRSGEESEFRVHAPEPYRLDLWRYGLQVEHVRNLGWHDEHGPRATAQITPDGDYSQTGVRWNSVGYPSRVHRQFVAGPERSGLYYFLASTRSGLRFGFPWVVAPARPTAPVAYLAGTITWNAYNNFGGRSNYISPDRLPSEPTVNARQELRRYTDPNFVTYDADSYAPLSFDRPDPNTDIDPDERATDPIQGRAACHLAPAEWRILAWLEREGVPHDVYAENQLHDGTLDLDSYRVLVLGPHPEYWTKVMYDRVNDWVEHRGGRLLYLGGNGIDCEVSLPTPDAMIVHNGRESLVYPQGFESRFHRSTGVSQAELLGVAFSYAGIMTAAPFRVLDARHWAFAGTGLQDGDRFGTRSLHMRCEGGASGHETDKVTPHSPPDVVVLARGENPDEGGAHLALRATASGGAVFAAGSITFPACLLVDETVSTLTANILRRFLDEGPVSTRP